MRTVPASRKVKYELRDVEKPNLYREIFPYSEVPRILYDNEAPPMSLPDDIFITCTTFRDGQQAMPPYSPKQIVDLYTLLSKLSGPNGVIRQCEFFLYSDKDREAVTKCMEKGFRYPEVTGWIRAVKSDFQLVRQIGLKETGILTSASDYHIFLKLGKTRKQVMNDYLDIVRGALEAGVKPRCHLEDLTRTDFYGFAVPFVQELMALAEESKVPIKVRLCDTLGYGIPHPNASLPRGVPKLVTKLREECGVPSAQLEWHGHNDFHKVHINAVTAWLYGCSAANGTLLGFGERTGNPPIEALIIEYIGLKGSTNGIDTTAITDIAEYFKSELGIEIPNNYPFVGRNFNMTAAGIHADGLIKNEEIYNAFDTLSLLKRPIRIAVTDKSGLAGIAYWVDTHFGLTGEKKIAKHHPGIEKIAEEIDNEYKAKRVTSISDDEMEKLIRKYIPELF